PSRRPRGREGAGAEHRLPEGEGWGAGERASELRAPLASQSRSTPPAPRSTPPVSRFTFHVSRAAFTLVELLVAVALMSFIVLGLLAMFSQTQRAFRASMTQTDVLESGRIFTDMMARELGQLAPMDRPF